MKEAAWRENYITAETEPLNDHWAPCSRSAPLLRLKPLVYSDLILNNEFTIAFYLCADNLE